MATKNETFERCVEKLMADGHDKDSAYAICTASGAGDAGEGSKATPPPGPPPGAQGAAPNGEVVEMPQSPTSVPVEDLATKCLELGYSQEQANEIVQIIAQNFADPGDPQVILIPAGVAIEELISAAAEQVGVGSPGGGGAAATAAPPPAGPMKRVTLPGENVWLSRFYQFIGRRAENQEGQEKMDPKFVKSFEEHTKAVKELATEASSERKENNRRWNQLVQILAGALGVEIPTEEKPEEVPAAPMPAAPNPLAAMAAPAPMGGLPMKTVKRTKADEMASLIAWARANGWSPDEEAEPEAAAAESSEVEVEEPAAVIPEPKRAPMRKSVDPGKAGAPRASRRSSYLGIDIDTSDAAALRAGR